MTISHEELTQRVNSKYATLKGWDGYKAPEQCPQITSNQVKALIAVLAEILTEGK